MSRDHPNKPAASSADAAHEALSAVIVGSGECSAPWPLDGNLARVAQHMQQCGEAWEPGARLIGNCRACDIAAIAADYIKIRAAYYQLIYEVGTKHEGESRHDTARRYIRERENRIEGPACESLQNTETCHGPEAKP